MLTDAVFMCPGSHSYLKSHIVGCESKLSFREFIAADCCEAAKMARTLDKSFKRLKLVYDSTISNSFKVKYKHFKRFQESFDCALKREKELKEQLNKDEKAETRSLLEAAVTHRKEVQKRMQVLMLRAAYALDPGTF